MFSLLSFCPCSSLSELLKKRKSNKYKTKNKWKFFKTKKESESLVFVIPFERQKNQIVPLQENIHK